MHHYIYSNKINTRNIYMHVFINKLFPKYNLENINQLKEIFKISTNQRTDIPSPDIIKVTIL